MLALERKNMYINEYNLDEESARVIVKDINIANYYEKCFDSLLKKFGHIKQEVPEKYNSLLGSKNSTVKSDASKILAEEQKQKEEEAPKNEKILINTYYCNLFLNICFCYADIGKKNIL